MTKTKKPGPTPPSREELLARAAALGYRIVEQEEVRVLVGEDYWTVAGHCDRPAKTLTVSTHRWQQVGYVSGYRPRSDEERRAILHHEVEHAEGKAKATNYPQFNLYCGGNVPEARALPETSNGRPTVVERPEAGRGGSEEARQDPQAERPPDDGGR